MEIRGLQASELEQAFELDADAFHQPVERKEHFLRFVDPADLTGAFDGGRLVGLCGGIRLAQWFGGRSVSMGGLSSVAVAPDRRGGGLARKVIEATLHSLLERGDAVSSLWPATTSLYRSLGWEVGGCHTIRRTEPRSLRDLPRPTHERLRPYEPADAAAVRDCYARVASETDGFLDRPDHWWQRIEARWQERDVYVSCGSDGVPDGYVAYRQIDGEHSELGGPFGLAVDEVIATCRDATLALWRLIGSWGSQADRVIYRGAAEDPLLLHLPEQGFTTIGEIRWMTRVLDAARAIEQRGFAPGFDAEVHLSLRDPLLARNHGSFVLTVAKGEGRLAPGGGGDVALDIGGFSALYTGWATSAVLRRSGRLSGGSRSDDTVLDAVFSGPTPWLLDEF